MATLTTIFLVITSTIGTIAGLASAASKFIDPMSQLGLWVAWVASCPVGHSPRVIETKALPKKDSQ